MQKKTKTQKYVANMRTYYLTDENLNILKTLNELILSAPNRTKLVNFAIDQVLGKIYSGIDNAKTPKERENKIVKFTREIKKYADNEEVIT